MNASSHRRQSRSTRAGCAGVTRRAPRARVREQVCRARPPSILWSRPRRRAGRARERLLHRHHNGGVPERARRKAARARSGRTRPAFSSETPSSASRRALSAVYAATLSTSRSAGRQRRGRPRRLPPPRACAATRLAGLLGGVGNLAFFLGGRGGHTGRHQCGRRLPRCSAACRRSPRPTPLGLKRRRPIEVALDGVATFRRVDQRAALYWSLPRPWNHHPSRRRRVSARTATSRWCGRPGAQGRQSPRRLDEPQIVRHGGGARAQEARPRRQQDRRRGGRATWATPARGAVPRTRGARLNRNKIGDEGLRTWPTPSHAGAAPALKELYNLGDNPASGTAQYFVQDAERAGERAAAPRASSHARRDQPRRTRRTWARETNGERDE